MFKKSLRREYRRDCVSALTFTSQLIVSLAWRLLHACLEISGVFCERKFNFQCSAYFRALCGEQRIKFRKVLEHFRKFQIILDGCVMCQMFMKFHGVSRLFERFVADYRGARKLLYAISEILIPLLRN